MKKLRRKKLASPEAANAYLEAEYLPEHNRRFAQPAIRREDYHRPRPCATELEKIFRLERERVISEDCVVRYDTGLFQLEPESRVYAPARGKVVVCEARDGQVSIEYRGRAGPWKEIAPCAQPGDSERVRKQASAPATPAANHQWVPPADHPWRKATRRAAIRRDLARELAARRAASLALSCASP